MSRSRKMIWFFAALVVGYLGYTSLPDGAEMLSGARARQSEITEIRARLEKAEKAAGDATFKDRLERSRTLIPPDADLPGLIAEIDTAVRSAGMTWSSGSPSPAAQDTESGVSSWTMNIALTGSARRVPDLVEALTSLPRLVVLDSLQVRGDGSASISIGLRFFAAPVSGLPATGEVTK